MRTFALALQVMLVGTLAFAQQAPLPVAGTWEGALQAGVVKLRLGVTIAAQAGGMYNEVIGANTVFELPGLNHLFQTARTGLPAEYGQIEETIAPAALEKITTWIRERTGLAR